MRSLLQDVSANVALPSWPVMLGLKRGTSKVAMMLRHEQLAMIHRASPLIALLFISHAAAVTLKLQATPLARAALFWLAAHVPLLTYALLQSSYGARAVTSDELARRFRAVVIWASALALLWNIFLAAALAIAPFAVAISLLGIQLSLIGAGAFVLASAPLAALLYLAIFFLAHAMFASSIVAPGLPLATSLALIAIMSAAMLRGLLLAAQAMARQVTAKQALSERGEMIAMLLQEFEQSGNGWFWTIDDKNVITHASSKLGEYLKCEISDLIGHPITQLPAHVRVKTPVLYPAIARREPFRNLEVNANIKGEERWWLVSGTPLLSSDGAFVGFTGVGCDVTEARHTRDQIERMARQDALTGLPNRTMLRVHIQAALDALVGGASASCAVMIIDLDRFKQVNDTMGHHAGDDLLREAAQRISDAMQHGGVAARLGGDEFAIVLSGVSASAARALAQRIVGRIAEPFAIRGQDVRIGASIGISMGPADGRTIEDLMRAADMALYRAKDDGRGRVRLYDAQLQDHATARLALETALRGSLENGEFSLAFQPIVDLASGEVSAFEALLRWYNSELGQVSPACFIPIAEELGLIDAIGEWVLRQACAEASRWPDHIGISVNLSAAQLANPSFIGIVLGALSQSRIAPRRLELEVTESIFLGDDPCIRGALTALMRMGVRIGLDDFGTGYSSLGYLRSTAFDTIKIDRCFTREAVDGSSQSAAIVRHIVELAASLGMQTVAEGAETEAEMAAVRALGCSRVQGYFTGRPMTAEAAAVIAKAAKPCGSKPALAA